MQMMLVHECAEARLVLTPTVLDQSPLQGSDTSQVRPEWSRQPKPKWGKTIHFKPLGDPQTINGKLYRGHCFLEDPDLYARLRVHPRYGESFIALDLESGNEMLPEDAFFVKKKSGGFKCVACNKELANEQGLYGHKESNAHSENVNLYLRGLEDALLGY